VPALADTNTSPAIVVERDVMWIGATTTHALPNAIERVPPTRHAVRAVAETCGFSRQTAATAAISASQTIRTDRFLCAAITPCVGIPAPILAGRLTEYRPTPKSSAWHARICGSASWAQKSISHRSGLHPGRWLGTVPRCLRNTRGRPARSARIIAEQTSGVYRNVDTMGRNPAVFICTNPTTVFWSNHQ
jgi:hypothetical protein